MKYGFHGKAVCPHYEFVSAGLVRTPPPPYNLGLTKISLTKKLLVMVVIRLSRGGSRGAPFFNIVVADSRNRRDGRYIERLGFYNPVGKEGAENLRIAQDRLTFWTSKGAQMSDTVTQLAKNAAKAAIAKVSAAPAAALAAA